MGILTSDILFNVRIKVFSPEGDRKYAFGKGTALLLRGVDEHHSLNKAAKEMGMAYSKAWKSLNATEEYLGFKLIERQGQRGSMLTDKGRRFLEIYEEAEKKASQAAFDVFDNSEFEL